MIGDKDVEHVARLARLALTESERARMREQLSAILQYIDKLKAVDVEGVEPTSHAVPLLTSCATTSPRRACPSPRRSPTLPIAWASSSGSRGSLKTDAKPDPTQLTIHELVDAYRAGSSTPTAATEAYLARIAAHDAKVGAISPSRARRRWPRRTSPTSDIARASRAGRSTARRSRSRTCSVRAASAPRAGRRSSTGSFRPTTPPW